MNDEKVIDERKLEIGDYIGFGIKPLPLQAKYDEKYFVYSLQNVQCDIIDLTQLDDDAMESPVNIEQYCELVTVKDEKRRSFCEDNGNRRADVTPNEISEQRHMKKMKKTFKIEHNYTRPPVDTFLLNEEIMSSFMVELEMNFDEKELGKHFDVFEQGNSKEIEDIKKPKKIFLTYFDEVKLDEVESVDFRDIFVKLNRLEAEKDLLALSNNSNEHFNEKLLENSMKIEEIILNDDKNCIENEVKLEYYNINDQKSSEFDSVDEKIIENCNRIIKQEKIIQNSLKVKTKKSKVAKKLKKSQNIHKNRLINVKTSLKNDESTLKLDYQPENDQTLLDDLEKLVKSATLKELQEVDKISINNPTNINKKSLKSTKTSHKLIKTNKAESKGFRTKKELRTIQSDITNSKSRKTMIKKLLKKRKNYKAHRNIVTRNSMRTLNAYSSQDNDEIKSMVEEDMNLIDENVIVDDNSLNKIDVKFNENIKTIKEPEELEIESKIQIKTEKRVPKTYSRKRRIMQLLQNFKGKNKKVEIDLKPTVPILKEFTIELERIDLSKFQSKKPDDTIFFTYKVFKEESCSEVDENPQKMEGCSEVDENPQKMEVCEEDLASELETVLTESINGENDENMLVDNEIITESDDPAYSSIELSADTLNVDDSLIENVDLHENNFNLEPCSLPLELNPPFEENSSQPFLDHLNASKSNEDPMIIEGQTLSASVEETSTILKENPVIFKNSSGIEARRKRIMQQIMNERIKRAKATKPPGSKGKIKKKKAVKNTNEQATDLAEEKGSNILRSLLVSNRPANYFSMYNKNSQKTTKTTIDENVNASKCEEIKLERSRLMELLTEHFEYTNIEDLNHNQEKIDDAKPQVSVDDQTNTESSANTQEDFNEISIELNQSSSEDNTHLNAEHTALNMSTTPTSSGDDEDDHHHHLGLTSTSHESENDQIMYANDSENDERYSDDERIRKMEVFYCNGIHASLRSVLKSASVVSAKKKISFCNSVYVRTFIPEDYEDEEEDDDECYD